MTVFAGYDLVLNPQALQQLRLLAASVPRRASRLTTALEEFAREGFGSRLARNKNGSVEVHIVPPAYVLAVSGPDDAALMRVDHQAKRVELVAIIFECGNLEERAWETIYQMAERMVS